MIVFPCYPKNVTIDFYEVLNDVKSVIAYSDPANAEYNKTTEKDEKKTRTTVLRNGKSAKTGNSSSSSNGTLDRKPKRSVDKANRIWYNQTESK